MLFFEFKKKPIKIKKRRWRDVNDCKACGDQIIDYCSREYFKEKGFQIIECVLDKDEPKLI